MKIFSTFSGIGGFEIGIERAFNNRPNLRNRPALLSENSSDTSESPLRFVGYSEIDKYAIKVYEKQFPGVKNYGDITKINAKELPDFDCLIGGFPCQAFSIAGKRRGFDDTRGTLFFDLARILREKQPRYFVFENVKGLLSHDKGNTFRTIIDTIDELGYDCQWSVLNSKNFGVPQNRERVYIVGHSRGTPRPEVFPIAGTDSADTFIRTIRAGGAASYTEKHARDIIRIGNVNPSGRGMNGNVISSEGLSSTLSTNKGEGIKVADIRQLNQPTHSNDRVYASDGISPTLNTMQGGNRQPKIVAQRGRGEPPVQQLEARPDDITNTITSVQKDNMVMIPEATKKGYAEAKVGDAVNLTAINSKTRRGRVSDIAPTLDTGMQIHTVVDTRQMSREGVPRVSESVPTLNATMHKEMYKVSDGIKIRRLTPMECERLQGFPDNWTKMGVQDGVQVEISDSQRYKMCGNAVTVNVVQAVFERILK